MEKTNNKKISLAEAVIVIIVVLALLGSIMVFLPGASPHVAIIVSLVLLLIYGLIRGYSYKYAQDAMIKSVSSSMGAIYLFFFIGILISSLMMCGAIPTLMYYGLGLISANTFYLSAFVISSIIGIAIGSSLTTVSTLGVAMLGISLAFGADPAITAGSIVSGAFLGDKMSPLSDTTGMASSLVGVDLFDHIKNMTKTTIPAFIVAGIIYYLFSTKLNIGSFEKIEAFKSDILSTELVHSYALIPFIALLLLAIFKVSSVVSIIIVSLMSLAISYFHHVYTVIDISNFLYSGFKMDGIPDSIVSLVSRGGINSMFFTITIIILALSLGGLLFAFNIISTILENLSSKLNTRFKATLSVALTGLLTNFIVGEQYLSILLTGETFKPVYDKLGLHRKNLSRALEDSGTVINPLVPWSVCGTFIANTLGISVLSYFPYAIFCYLCIVFTIISGLTGIGLKDKNKK